MMAQSSAVRWHVAQCCPRGEFVAKMNIVDKLKLDAFFPTEEARRSIGRRSADIVVPLFPGYIFVEFDAGVTAWRDINKLRGVMRLLCKDDRPLAVPMGQVEQLRQRANSDGLIVEPDRIIAEMGDWAHIMLGTFAKFSGPLAEPLHTKDETAFIQLRLLGRDVVVKVPVENLAASV